MQLVLATRNAHKLTEVARMLEPFALSVVALPTAVALPPEDGRTYAENALGKARAAALALGVPAIADDSGVESAALDGRPGVRSARYAGEHASDAENLAKLLARATAGSPLRYVCALAFVAPRDAPPFERVFLGECGGRLAAVPAGHGGFGYDPAFIPDERADHLTLAELTESEKDAISHRGRALRAFAQWFTAAHPTG